ncbi:MAG TPA: sialidase family protein [Mycobacteriales bacterium]|nr:sialidase family protein [Mycobacteriales bacterium]
MRTRPTMHLLAVVLAGAAAAAAVPGSAAPPPRWAAPVLISETKAAREISLVLSPTDPRFLAACAPSGVPATGNGQSYFHATKDTGKTWAPLNVETAATDTRRAAFEGGDCDVAFDQGGTLYSADTWLGNLSVGASTDGGKTWSGTALAVSAPVVDRPWLVGGPKGTVYLSYHDVQCCMPSAMWFTKSTDFGKTFLPAVPIPTPGPEGAFIWEGNYVVAPNAKDIYLTYSRRLAPTGADTGMDIFLATSRDGGLTWSSSPVASLAKATSSIYPSIGLDGGGGLHVVWSAPEDDANPVFLTSSVDAGRTWTEPLPLISGATGHAPWVVGGARRGEAAVVWLGSPSAKTDADSHWYFYASRIKPGRTGRPSVNTGRTTPKPLFTGAQIAPEFEMVTLDKKGRMHVGMAIYRERENGSKGWALYSQRELSVPR